MACSTSSTSGGSGDQTILLRSRKRTSAAQLDGLGQGFVLEVQLECFPKVGESLVGRASLAGHLDLQCPGDVPPAFMRNRCRELHDHHTTTTRFAPWTATPREVAGRASGAPGLPECETLAVGRRAGDQPGGSAREGPPCGVLGVRGIHRVATTVAATVAITPASTVASPERSTLSRAKCQRVATPLPPVVNPDSLGLFS